MFWLDWLQAGGAMRGKPAPWASTPLEACARFAGLRCLASKWMSIRPLQPLR